MGESLTAFDATAIVSGTLAAARGGAGTSNGILKADGAGLVSAATAGTDYYKSGATTSAPQMIILTGVQGAPVDATTYFFGSNVNLATGALSMNTTATRRAVTIPFACTITKAYVRVSNDGTLGTTETSTLSLRLNDTTDTTILNNTLTTNPASAAFNNTSLSIAIAAGDFIEMKWVTPSWATNPTLVGITVSLELHP